MNESHDDNIDALLRRQFEGPVNDDGFSDKLMQRLPPHRRRIAWPLWLGLLSGAIACWLCLGSVPLFQAGWRDWLAGELSPPAITLLLTMATLSLLAMAVGLLESRSE